MIGRGFRWRDRPARDPGPTPNVGGGGQRPAAAGVPPAIVFSLRGLDKVVELGAEKARLDAIREILRHSTSWSPELVQIAQLALVELGEGVKPHGAP